MTNNYIDNAETQKYGPDLRANLQRRFGADSRPAVRALVAWLIAHQAKADETMADALAAHRRAKATSAMTSESGSRCRRRTSRRSKPPLRPRMPPPRPRFPSPKQPLAAPSRRGRPASPSTPLTTPAAPRG